MVCVCVYVRVFTYVCVCECVCECVTYMYKYMCMWAQDRIQYAHAPPHTTRALCSGSVSCYVNFVMWPLLIGIFMTGVFSYEYHYCLPGHTQVHSILDVATHNQLFEVALMVLLLPLVITWPSSERDISYWSELIGTGLELGMDLSQWTVY